MKYLSPLVLLIFCGISANSSTNAATMSISFQDSVGGLIVSYSGSVDTTGLDTFPTTVNSLPVIGLGDSINGVDRFDFNGEQTPFQAVTFVGNLVANPDIISFFDTASLSPVSGIGVGSGDIFSFTMDDNGFFLYLLPAGYVSGTNVSGSATFAGLTVADFGDLPGALDGPSNDFSLSAGNTLGFSSALAVPEPSCFVLLGIAAMSLGGRGLRHRKQ